MLNIQLRTDILATLGMTDASPLERDAVLVTLENTARRQVIQLVPELLTEAQLYEVEKMRADGADEQTILAWLDQRIPTYQEMMEMCIRSLADQAAQLRSGPGPQR